MNQTHWLSRLLVIGAALEAPVGLGLLIAPSAPAGLGVAGAFLVYNVAASVVLALARPAPTTSPLQLGAAVLHGFLAIGLSVALLGHQRRSGGS